jgi:hypothetical protein
MNTKRCHLFRRTAALLGGLALTSLAQAAVIQGTGSVPTSVSLGTTDAVGFTMADSGPGHILVVPYFTAQNGQGSVLHLVNTDVNNGKVIKLRYRGAGNGDTLLDFLVLLSPGDVWTGLVFARADGLARLVTADKSCTFPRLGELSEVAFNTARLNPTLPDADKFNHTREGSIEAIVVADIPSGASYGSASNERSALFTAIKQVNGIAPCTTAALDASLLTDITSEATAASRGLATPTGGVGGSWYIIDIPNTTTFAGAATAFKAVNAAGKNARGNFVLFPQSNDPVSQPERFTADPLLVSAGLAGRSKDASGNLSNLTTAPVLTARFSDLPDLSTPYYLPASALNARVTAGDLSQLMAVTEVSNQYTGESSISAKTDWVFALPTKRYSVAVDYSQASATDASSTALVFSAVPPAAANNQYFYRATTSLRENTFFGRSGVASACTLYGVRGLGGAPDDEILYDREGTLKGPGPVFIGSIQPMRFCGAADVMRVAPNFSAPSALSASVSTHDNPSPFSNGWRKIKPIDATTGLGLPILGASFIKLSNPNAQPGVSGNYGITWSHMMTK